MYVCRSSLSYINCILGNSRMKRPQGTPERRKSRAFSLIEVVVALGIVTFAGFALIGLFSVGLKNTRDSKMQLQAATIMEQMCSVRRSAATNDLSQIQTNFALPVLSSSLSNLSSPT